MAKGKRGKAPKRPVKYPSPKIVTAVAAELTIARRLVKILGIFALVMFFPIMYAYSSYDLGTVRKTSGFYVLLGCMGLLLVFMDIQIWLGHQDKKRISASHLAGRTLPNIEETEN